MACTFLNEYDDEFIFDNEKRSFETYYESFQQQIFQNHFDEDGASKKSMRHALNGSVRESRFILNLHFNKQKN